jgi:8-oxo-dGTP pyrophosphatase MutT (NUDIX family)
MGLTSLIEQVKAHKPRVLGLNTLASAAVLVAITDQAEPEVILTLRSSELSTHQGEVAFPGGKTDETDTSYIETALREAHEEIGLSPDLVTVIGELDQVVSRYGFLVTPILGIVPENVELIGEPGEIESIFRVPLKFFLDGQPDQIDQFGSFKGPRWYYERYTIWGLTAVMLAEMFNSFYGADFELAIGNIDEYLASSLT